MVINAFKNNIFPFYYKQSDFRYKNEDRDEGEHENEDEFHTPKEVTPRSKISDFGIKKSLKMK